MKQTAVEWLAKEIQEQLNMFFPNATLYQPTIEQAKEMEKKQIMDAWDNGYDKGTRDRIEKISNPVGNAEQYYNETFKS